MHHKSDVLDLDLEPQDDEVVVSSKYDEAVSRLVKIMSDSSLRFFAQNADSSTGQVGLLLNCSIFTACEQHTAPAHL